MQGTVKGQSGLDGCTRTSIGTRKKQSQFLRWKKALKLC